MVMDDVTNVKPEIVEVDIVFKVRVAIAPETFVPPPVPVAFSSIIMA
jgi:hypothetical protein